MLRANEVKRSNTMPNVTPGKVIKEGNIYFLITLNKDGSEEKYEIPKAIVELLETFGLIEISTENK